MAVKYYRDFSGGYADNAEQTSLPDNVMGNIENMYWDGGLKKRRGAATLATSTAAGAVGILGIIHDYLYGTGFICAIQDATHVHFYAWDSTTGWTTIGTKTFTSAYSVYFAYLNGYIVATNGIDKPLVIWYSAATYYSDDLEQKDARTRDVADWVAGQYTAGTTTYTDDTTDAQDVGAADFQFVSTTNGDGFYMGCFYIFSKCVFTEATQAVGVVVVYEYSKAGNTWGTLTPTATPDFTAATGDKTLEFDIPLDWAVWEDDTAATLVNKYLIRARFTTAPAGAQTFDLITVSYTRSVSFALQNQAAVIVKEHGGRLWLSAGEIVAYSTFNSVLGWEPYFVEYFQGGTKTISNLVSHQNALYVFKNSMVYKYSGTSFDNYIKSKIADVGTTLTNCAISAGDNLLFFSENKAYLITASDSVVEVLSHADVPSVSHLTYYDKKIWASYGVLKQYVIDPAKLIEIDGKPCLAIFDITPATPDNHSFRAIRYSATAEYLIGISTATTTIMRYDNSVYSDEKSSATAFVTLLKTKLIDEGVSSTRKVIPRIKVEALDGTDLVTTFRDDAGIAIASGTQTKKLNFDGLTDAITNGGLESVITTGWNNTVGTVTGTSRDTTTKRTGTGSFKIAPTGALCGRGNGTWVTSADPMSFYITGYYNMTAWTAGSVVIDVGSALTHATAFIYANLATITAVSGGWVKFEKAVSAKSGAYLKIYAPAGSTNVCYIDDITIYPLTRFVTYEFTPPYEVDGKNFALELSQTSLAETSIKSIGIEYSPRRF